MGRGKGTVDLAINVTSGGINLPERFLLSSPVFTHNQGVSVSQKTRWRGSLLGELVQFLRTFPQELLSRHLNVFQQEGNIFLFHLFGQRSFTSIYIPNKYTCYIYRLNVKKVKNPLLKYGLDFDKLEPLQLESKIRPVAQISPFGSFVPLVNLAGVGTPDPPWAGAFAPALTLPATQFL